jgi:hypothetical protein
LISDLGSQISDLGSQISDPFDELRANGNKRRRKEERLSANASFLFSPFPLISSKRSCGHYCEEPFDEGQTRNGRVSV